jgi:hypothetical protein
MSEELIQSEPAEAGTSRRKMLAGMGVAAGGGLLALAGTQSAQAVVSDASYYSYGPYRYVDTRQSGGRIYGGDTRVLSIFAGLESYTFAVNLTVVNTHGSGWLELYNADLSTRPSPYSSINWQGDNKVVANFTMLDLGSAGAKIYCSGGSSTNTHFIIDVVGYMVTGGAAAAAVPAEVKAAEKRARRQLER